MPQLIAVCLRFVSLRLTHNAGKHTVLQISYFSLVLDGFLAFSTVKFLHLPHDLLLIFS